MTIRRAIDNLVEYGMISPRKQNDKPNSQVWELYINKDSIFQSVYSELDNFRNLFFDSNRKNNKKESTSDNE